MVLVRLSIGHSSVDQAALNRPVTKVIPDEVDRLPGIEEVRRYRVARQMDVRRARSVAPA
jgi:hypothetical protein